MDYIESRCVMAESASNVVIAAFSEEETQRLTKISLGQLRHWSRTGFFQPSLRIDLGAEPAGDSEEELDSRVIYFYSFRDLVSLQVLNAIRNEAKVTLQHLRKVKNELRALGDDVWAKYSLYILKKKVHFRNPDTDRIEEVLTRQGVLEIPLEIMRANMKSAVRNLRERTQADFGRIHTKRGVVRSRPVIAGTGIEVSTIKAYAEAGYSPAQIIKEYPSLTERDVEAAISFKDAAA